MEAVVTCDCRCGGGHFDIVNGELRTFPFRKLLNLRVNLTVEIRRDPFPIHFCSRDALL